MSLLPIFLKLNGRSVLVVGGGVIAEAKIVQLLASEASVRVVAPEASETIRRWAQSGEVEWRPRAFDPRDIDHAELVIGATSSPEVNHIVYREARAKGVFCNIVDDPPHCDFYFPAIVRRGDLQIAISTNGQSPAFAQRLRRELEAQFGPEYGERLSRLGEHRQRILLSHPAGPARTALLQSLAYSNSGDHSSIGAHDYDER